jgi:predicted O-methyltransferase YrrM
MNTIFSTSSLRLRESYVFSQDWFSNHIPTWDYVLERLRPRRLLEIGCYEGRATTFLIERCAEYGPLHMTCIDTWAGSIDLPQRRMAGVEDRFDRNIGLAIGRATAAVTFSKVKAPSAKALAGLLASDAERFDFIYVDGSHTAPDVLIDALLAFRLLRIGGIIVFDDYLWTMEPHICADVLNMPKPAIDVFAMIFTRKVRMLPGVPNSQCYLEKIAE